jgi:hypothetical protein
MKGALVPFVVSIASGHFKYKTSAIAMNAPRHPHSRPDHTPNHGLLISP